jgi:hypothetical protein
LIHQLPNEPAALRAVRPIRARKHEGAVLHVQHECRRARGRSDELAQSRDPRLVRVFGEHQAHVLGVRNANRLTYDTNLLHRAPPASDRRATLAVRVPVTVIGRTLPGRETYANCLAKSSVRMTGTHVCGDVHLHALHASSRRLNECRQGNLLPLSWIEGPLTLATSELAHGIQRRDVFSARTKLLPRLRLVPRGQYWAATRERHRIAQRRRFLSGFRLSWSGFLEREQGGRQLGGRPV